MQMLQLGRARLHGQILDAPVIDFRLMEGEQPSKSITTTSTKSIVAILFTDVVGFTRIREDEIPRFVGLFMGGVANLFDRDAYAVLAKNTWGDALYTVFQRVEDAGVFALRLRDFVASTDWQAEGLSAEIGIRIALHAGPAYRQYEPVLRQNTFVGTHVSLAARIEPITPPGTIYASESFAALAAAEGTPRFHCEYAGEVSLAKKYGKTRAFVVHGAP